MNKAIKKVSFLLFVNMGIVFIYKLITNFDIGILDGIVYGIILSMDLYFVRKNIKKDNCFCERRTEEVSKKTLLIIVGILMLFAFAYGPFLVTMRKNIVQDIPLSPLFFQCIYMFALVFIYLWVDQVKNHLEIVIMVFTASIVIIQVLGTYVQNLWGDFFFGLAIQFLYGILHSILGGLVVMVAYLYKDTIKNIIFLFLLTGFSFCCGLFIPEYMMGNTPFNILLTLISLVIVMTLIMFLQNYVLYVFRDTLMNYEQRSQKTKRIQQLQGYEQLTEREKEVSALLVDTYTNKEIALRLKISENTLKKHAKSIYDKLNVKNKRMLKEALEKTEEKC